MYGIADEYDAAQERGEIKKVDNPIVSSGEQLPGPADLGLSRKHIHNARIIRDSVEEDVRAIENRKSFLRAVNSPLLLVIHTK